MNKDMNKNLKDGEKDSIKDTLSVPTSLGTPIQTRHIFYGKTDKLITALYMVTDIIDKEEPVRHRLRILGTEIISDMHSNSAEVSNKITEVVSFLNIASAMNFISEMNCAILRKEFLDLNKSLGENTSLKTTWLAEFLGTPTQENVLEVENDPKGHTRIGVQKGSTLMKALSDINGNKKINPTASVSRAQDFEISKKERRFNVINVIKNSSSGATIKDIMIKINSSAPGGVSYSEKTLQRELMSMIKDGVLYKTGEKRWSRYFIKILGS